MRKVTLNMNELQKYEIIKNLVDTNGSKQRAALKLNSTMRTINNLIIRYNKHGKAGFQHGNKYRSPKRALTTLQKESIVTLYKTKYFGANIQHFKELLERNEDIIISYTPLRLLLLEQDCLSPKAHRSTRKKQKAKIKAMLKSTKTDSIVKTAVLHSSLQALEDSHPKRARCKYAGEMIQMDASSFNWYGESIDHLHLAIDDCTGEVVGAYFDTQETLKGYYQVYKQILVKYGIPFQFLTDKRTVFEYNQKKNATTEDDTFTQFSYACSVLGTDIRTSSVPQAKGRIERLNGTFQSRLPIELRLKDISTIEEANIFLESYVKDYNKRFSLRNKDTKSVYEKQPSSSKINLTLAILSERKIDNGHCIKFKNEYYMPYKGSMKQCFRPGTTTLVIEALNKQKYLTVDENVYLLNKVENHQEYSKNFDIVPEEKKKIPHVPPMSHPWKAESF